MGFEKVGVVRAENGDGAMIRGYAKKMIVYGKKNPKHNLALDADQAILFSGSTGRMSPGEELESQLRRLLDVVTRHRVEPGGDAWKSQAIFTIVANIDRYLQAVSSAIASRSSHELRRSACRASSLRKGVADIGLFADPHDDGILQLIEQVVETADEICLS